MCNSILRGKDYIEDWYREHIDSINSVLDIGCGRGIYPGCLKAIKPEVRWVGIEIWQPYIDKYKDILNRLYDNILIMDVDEYDFNEKYDLIIMGDVLEHMSKEKAASVLFKAYTNCRYFIISIPLGNCPHEAEHGNPYQKHVVEDWTHRSVSKFIFDTTNVGIITSRIFDCAWLNNPIEIGVFICKGAL